MEGRAKGWDQRMTERDFSRLHNWLHCLLDNVDTPSCIPSLMNGLIKAVVIQDTVRRTGSILITMVHKHKLQTK